MLSAQTHALQKNKNGGQIPHFLREIEVASDSDPLFSFLLRVPYNVRFPDALLRSFPHGRPAFSCSFPQTDPL